VLRDPETVNSPDMPEQSQNDLIGTISRQPELEPAAAPNGGPAFGTWIMTGYGP